MARLNQDFPTARENLVFLLNPSPSQSLNFLLRSHFPPLLKNWRSKFLASLIAEEASTSPSAVLTSLKAVVRSFGHFHVMIAGRLINLMAGTKAKTVVARLKNSAQDFSLQKSIKSMAAATQQLAKSSTPHSQQKPPFQRGGLSPQEQETSLKRSQVLQAHGTWSPYLATTFHST